MSEICKSGRIVVDIDTIVILFMRARSVIAIEIKCLYPLQPFQRSFTVMFIFIIIILLCKSTTHTVAILQLMQ